MPERIRVFVVDDHALFRTGLLRLLDADETLVVVGSAASAASALEQLKHIETDVLILDYQLGTDNALTVARGLRERNFQGRSLVVTAGLPDQDALELIRLGVSGIFHKVHSPEDLHRTIREVAAGKMLIDQSYVQKLAESMTQLRDTPSRLTERDRRVLRLLLEGYSNKEIATELKLSESSAKGPAVSWFVSPSRSCATKSDTAPLLPRLGARFPPDRARSAHSIAGSPNRMRIREPPSLSRLESGFSCKLRFCPPPWSISAKRHYLSWEGVQMLFAMVLSAAFTLGAVPMQWVAIP